MNYSSNPQTATVGGRAGARKPRDILEPSRPAILRPHLGVGSSHSHTRPSHRYDSWLGTLGGAIPSRVRVSIAASPRAAVPNYSLALVLYLFLCGYRCRANVAHVRQSRPDSGLGFQAIVLKTLSVVPSSLGSGPRKRSSGAACPVEGAPGKGGEHIGPDGRFCRKVFSI